MTEPTFVSNRLRLCGGTSKKPPSKQLYRRRTGMLTTYTISNHLLFVNYNLRISDAQLVQTGSSAAVVGCIAVLSWTAADRSR